MSETTRGIKVKLGVTDSGFSSGIAEASRKLDGFGKITDGAGGRIKDTWSGIGTAAVVGVGVAVGALGMLAKSSLSAARDYELTNRRLDAVYKSMGLGAKALEQTKLFSGQLSTDIGVDDDDIRSVQAIGATFSNLAKDQGKFNRATTLAFDLQAAGIGDAKANMLQLGKALQDPIKGMTALSRSGVSFTQAEKDRVEQLVKSNQLGKAQEVILKAVETQVGGTAAATATATMKMAQGWDNVTTSLGLGLTGPLDKVADRVTALMVDPKVTKSLTDLGASVGNVLDQLTGSVNLPTADRLAGWIEQVATGIPTLVTEGEKLWPKIRDEWTPAAKDLINTAKDFGTGTKSGIWTILDLTGDAINKLPDGWRDDVGTLVGAAAAFGAVNKLTGGIPVKTVTTIAGSIKDAIFGKGGILGDKSAVMNVDAAVVNVNGGGAVGAAEGALGGGKGGKGGVVGSVAKKAGAAASLVAPEVVIPIAASVTLTSEGLKIADEWEKNANKKIAAALKGATSGIALDPRTVDLAVRVNDAVARKKLDDVGRDRTITILAAAKIAEAEGRIDDATRERIVDMVAKGDVEDAEKEIDRVAGAGYYATIQGTPQFGTVERALQAATLPRTTSIEAQAQIATAVSILANFVNTRRSTNVDFLANSAAVDSIVRQLQAGVTAPVVFQPLNRPVTAPIGGRPGAYAAALPVGGPVPYGAAAGGVAVATAPAIVVQIQGLVANAPETGRAVRDALSAFYGIGGNRP